MKILLENIYEYLNEDVLPEERKHLAGVDIDDLPGELEILSTEALQRLLTAVEVWKIHTGVLRMNRVKDKTKIIQLGPVNPPAPPVPLTSGRYYDGVFEVGAKKEDYHPEVWAIRQEFFIELEDNGGAVCPSCTRSSLIRKYTARIESLNAC